MVSGAFHTQHATGGHRPSVLFIKVVVGYVVCGSGLMCGGLGGGVCSEGCGGSVGVVGWCSV